jgi:outer membrane protein OmpA-like peptidoglycan-associated protein
MIEHDRGHMGDSSFRSHALHSRAERILDRLQPARRVVEVAQIVVPMTGSTARIALALVASAVASIAHAQPSDVPIAPGVNFVLAVSNAQSSAKAPKGILEGDYEMVVAITDVGADGVTHAASFDGQDAAGVQRQGTVRRVVSSADLDSAQVQVLGFHLDDPARVDGTTSLGPSRRVTRELLQVGVTSYSFRLWVGRETISGTLRRSATSPVRFPVLINGKRVELEAIHATGQMSLGEATRPFETIILDHPKYPVSLRIAYGPRDGAFPFKPDFAREVVRIDVPARPAAIADALASECRVELSGIYFDFNQATLKPQSAPALKDIAAALQAAPKRPLALEGHTDSIGSDRYNDDLSARRADAVKTALVREYGVNPAMLSTVGHGERRPIESNDTLAGRARNRRVELVCGSVP